MSWSPSLAKEFLTENKIKAYSPSFKKNIIVAPIESQEDDFEYDQIIVSPKNRMEIGQSVILNDQKYLLVGTPGFFTEYWDYQVFKILPDHRVIFVKKGKYKIICDIDERQKAIEKIDRFIKEDEFNKKVKIWVKRNKKHLKKLNHQYIILDLDKGIICFGQDKGKCIEEYHKVKDPNLSYNVEIFKVDGNKLNKEFFFN